LDIATPLSTPIQITALRSAGFAHRSAEAAETTKHGDRWVRGVFLKVFRVLCVLHLAGWTV